MDYIDEEIKVYEDHKTGLRYEVKFIDDGQCGPTYTISKVPDRIKIKKMIEIIYDPTSNRSCACVEYDECGAMGVEEIYISTAVGENYFIYEPSPNIKCFAKYIQPMLSWMMEVKNITSGALYMMGGDADFFSNYVIDVSDKTEYELCGYIPLAFCSRNDLVEGENVLVMALKDEAAHISFLVIENPSDDLKFFAKLLSEGEKC